MRSKQDLRSRYLFDLWSVPVIEQTVRSEVFIDSIERVRMFCSTTSARHTRSGIDDDTLRIDNASLN